MLDWGNSARAISSIGLVASLLMGSGCHSAREGGRSLHQDRDHLELQNASAEWDRHFNAAAADKLAALYAEDAVSMPPNLPTITGRKALQADFEDFFAGNVATHQTTIDEVRVDGDSSIERARYKMTFKPRAGGEQVVETGRHIEYRRKINGEWKIVIEIWNSDTPPK